VFNSGTEGEAELRKSKRERSRSAKAQSFPGEMQDGGRGNGLAYKRNKTTNGATSTSSSTCSSSSSSSSEAAQLRAAKKASKSDTLTGGENGSSGGSRAKSGSGHSGGGSADYVSHQQAVVSQKQQDLLRQSFQFLHTAQEVLEQKKFYQLVKQLVEYDKGAIEVCTLCASLSV